MGNTEPERKKNNFWLISTVVVYIVLQVILVINTWPGESAALNKLLDKAITATQNTTEKTCYTITQEEMNSALQTVAYSARKEAVDEYKKDFSILISVLAAFGIALPVVMAFMNYKFNEGEIKKINDAAAKADEAVRKAGDANYNADEAEKTANEASDIAIDAYNKANDAVSKLEDATETANNAAEIAKENNEETIKLQKDVYHSLYLLYFAKATEFNDKHMYYDALFFFAKADEVCFDAIEKFYNDQTFYEDFLYAVDSNHSLIFSEIMLSKVVNQLDDGGLDTIMSSFNQLHSRVKKLPETIETTNDKGEKITQGTIENKFNKIIFLLKNYNKFREENPDAAAPDDEDPQDDTGEK